MRCRSLTAGLVAGVLLLTACGDDGDDAASPDAAAQVVDGPGGDAAAGTCLEGTPDCEDTPMDPDQPVSGPADDGQPTGSDEGFATEEAREEARATLGRPEGELDTDIRIRRRGEESFMLTEDYVLGRITVELDDDGSGTYVVTSATVELPDGPETFEA